MPAAAACRYGWNTLTLIQPYIENAIGMACCNKKKKPEIFIDLKNSRRVFPGNREDNGIGREKGSH